MDKRITFLGGGNMASAITAGLIAQGHSPSCIRIVQRNLEKAEGLRKQFSVQVDQDYAGAIAWADVVIIAVKPQSFPELLEIVSVFLLTKKPLIVSIMSGIRLSRLRDALPGCSIIRVMPNTPSRVQKGFSLITPADPLVASIFGTIGQTFVTPTERSFEQLTALTGCGPAFVYYLVNEMALAMQALTPEIDCLPLACATFEGALAMMKADPSLSPEKLIAQVAPKGGMTAQAMTVLEQGKLEALFRDTLAAAIKRGDELA